MERGSKYDSRSSQKIKIVLAFICKYCGDRLPAKEIVASVFISEWM